MMQRLKHYCKTALSKDVIIRALKVSIVVGTTLNLINQWECIMALDIENLHKTKFFLTYLVPYGVATYSAMIMKFELHKEGIK